MSNENEIITSNEAISDSATIAVATVTEAQALLTELFSELKSYEQSKLASELSFDVLIRRAIYGINKETPTPEESFSSEAILPYVEAEGCSLERLQFLSTSIEVAIDTIKSDPNIFSLLDD